MHPQLQTCLLLLVGVLTSPGTGRTIGNKDNSRIHFESGDDTDPSSEHRTVNNPLRTNGPESYRVQNDRISSPEVGGAQVSRVKLEAPTSTPVPLERTSPVAAQQVGPSEQPMGVRPLLDEDRIVPFEIRRLKTTLPPSTSISGKTTVTPPVAVSNQPESDKVIPSKLAGVLESILNESEVRRQSTTRRPTQPPRIDLTPQKPPVGATGIATQFQEFLPQLEEALKSALVEHKPEEPRPPAAVHLPPPQTTKVTSTDGEEGVKDILPTLEEALGSIFKDSEAKGPTASSQPVLPPVRPTTTDVEHKLDEMKPSATVHLPPPQTPKVPPTDPEEDLKHILPSLEDALGSILKESEAKAPTTASHPVLPPVRLPTTDVEKQPPATVHLPLPQTPKVPPAYLEEDLKHFLPTLEEALGGILKDSETKAPTTASHPVQPPVRPTTTDVEHKLDEMKPSTTGHLPLPQTPKVPPTEEDLKQILPTLEEALGSIFKDSEAKTPTTTSRPVPPTVHPTTTDSGKHFAAVLPQLEDAIRSVLEEAVLEQEVTAQKHTSPPPARQPSPPPPTKDYGFGDFLPKLEQEFGDILRNGKSNQSATFPDDRTVPASTVKTPALPVTVPTEQQSSFQNNAIVPGGLPSDSKPLFQAVKSILQDVFSHQELEAKKHRAQP